MFNGRFRLYTVTGLAIAFILLVVSWLFLFGNQNSLSDPDFKHNPAPPPAPPAKPKTNETPAFKTEIVLDGVNHVWEIVFLPTSEMLFTERNGSINLFKKGSNREIHKVNDVYERGEGGLMGLAIDPNFKSNQFVYACFNSTISGSADVRIARWQMKADQSGLQNRQDIVTGMPSNASGRHSGCRINFGPDSYLWVGTGDAAQASNPQSPTSLGGKILRVDRDGKAAPGNLNSPYDPRVYSYGHRNTQGLAFYTESRQGIVGLSVEHGSTLDDEVNFLKPGNFGWDPDKGYTERGIPMTDKGKFPNAIDAIWKSGAPAQAPSGAVIVHGDKWHGWDGALAMAMLKTTHLKILRIDSNNTVTQEERVLEGQYGRLRAVTLGRDGNLYIGTTNGNDRIIRIVPD